MTAPHIVDPAGLPSQVLADASPDLRRELLQTMINALLSADAAGSAAPNGTPAPPSAPTAATVTPTPSSASSAPSRPARPTNVPKAAATTASKSWAAADSC